MQGVSGNRHFYRDQAMKIIAFINEAVVIREILNHLGEPTTHVQASRRTTAVGDAGCRAGRERSAGATGSGLEFDQSVAW